MKSGAVLGAINASRRLGENWKLALDGRMFITHDPTEPLYYFRRDDYLQFELQYRY